MVDMSRRSFLRVGGLAGLALASGAFFGCSQETGKGDSAQSASAANSQASSSAGEQVSSSQANVDAKAQVVPGKTLVAYFSAQGHTRRVAQAIADELGADLFEITPANPYSSDDLNYNDSESRVSREHDDESLRDVALAQTAPDAFAEYSTVFVGYPIWWAQAAWPTNHFAADNDFSGKKVIPFCTSASSGLGQSAQLLADAAGTGEWADGMRFSSGASDSDVRDWARSQ